MDRAQIEFFEELQSNAFPALQTVMYDGWSVRFGGGFTYRVNDANPMYPERLPAEEKIPFVEELYRNSGLGTCIIKIHDGMDPGQKAACQQILDQKGYGTERDGNIFVCDLSGFSRQPVHPVTVDGTLSDQWLEDFLTMNGTAEAQKAAARTMLKSIVYPVAAASIVEDGKMIACGLGVIERGHVGLYDIYVDASCRRRGLGADICTAIMQAGKAQGCTTAYLQVLSDNLGARALYRLLGYREEYEYWFRIKRFTLNA